MQVYVTGQQVFPKGAGLKALADKRIIQYSPEYVMEFPMSQKDPNGAEVPPSQTRNIPKMGGIFTEMVEHAISTGQHSVIRVAESGRNRLEERQLRKDLDHFWVRLGKTAFHLLEAGEIDHPALQKAATRINTLESQLDQVHSKSSRRKTSAE